MGLVVAFHFYLCLGDTKLVRDSYLASGFGGFGILKNCSRPGESIYPEV